MVRFLIRPARQHAPAHEKRQREREGIAAGSVGAYENPAKPEAA
jgi:hypothetical protein